MRAAVTDPVSGKDKGGRRDDGRPWPKMKDIDDGRADEDEGEEEGGAEPIDCCLIGLEVCCRLGCDGGKSKPLEGNEQATDADRASC